MSLLKINRNNFIQWHEGLVVIRIFGRGLKFKDYHAQGGGLMFSERSGYSPWWKIGKWIIAPLPSGDLLADPRKKYPTPPKAGKEVDLYSGDEVGVNISTCDHNWKTGIGIAPGIRPKQPTAVATEHKNHKYRICTKCGWSENI